MNGKFSKAMLGAALAAAAVLSTPTLAGPDAEKIKASGTKCIENKMQGFDRIVFDFEGCEAWLVEPKTPAADGRWVWCMEWPTAFQDRTGARAFLEAGYRWVTFNPACGGIMYGGRSPGNQTDEMIARRGRLQAHLVKTLGLNPRCGLIGMSWGGFYSVRYASTRPQDVVAAYLDAPLLDFTTLSGYRNAAAPDKPTGTQRGLSAYYDFVKPGYDGKDDPFQSVNRAEPIAKAGIPILLLYGAKDTVVPPEKNCLRFAEAFEKAGGALTMARRSRYGHHPHGVDPKDVSLLVNFFNRAYAAKPAAKKQTAARPRPKPNAVQLGRITSGLERIGIVHWGLNTFTDREWGFGDENPQDLNPAKFDADQIVGACRDGGLQGLVIVAKHHDGFCLWPTKTTEHNISKSPFRGGKGDYVREMEQACRKHGLKFGVYVSPWDRNSAFYGTDKYVSDVYRRQIRELLSGDYGKVFEMWFDGANGGDGYYGGAREKRKIGPGYYHFDEVFAEVRQMQPGVAIFANEDDGSDYRYPGNERGKLQPHSRATTERVGGYAAGVYGNPNYPRQLNTGSPNGDHFRPIEADFPLRPGWFYHAKEKGKTKHAAYLMQRYLDTVGNAATINIGIAPNRDGRLDDEDVRALRGFGDLLKVFFARTCDAQGRCNVVVLQENVANGELVDGWELKAGGKVVASGAAVGSKRIRLLDEPVAKDALAVAVTGGTPNGVKLSTFFVDPELAQLVKSATTESGETDTAKWMAAGKEGAQ